MKLFQDGSHLVERPVISCEIVRMKSPVSEGDRIMPNDAKLGLFVGVSLVIAVAVVFFRREVPATSTAAIPNEAMVRPVALPQPSTSSKRPIQGRLLTRNPDHETLD
jgi:hypothetical protein